MVRENDLDRAHRMFGRILDDLDAAPEPGPWIAGARTLSERLVIGDDAFYYLVAKLTECLVLAGSQADPELVRIRGEIEAIERAAGLREGEYWGVDEGPPEWRALDEEWGRRSDELVAMALRGWGHADIADVLMNDRAEFEERSAKGHTEIWGEEDEDDVFDEMH